MQFERLLDCSDVVIGGQHVAGQATTAKRRIAPMHALGFLVGNRRVHPVAGHIGLEGGKDHCDGQYQLTGDRGRVDLLAVATNVIPNFSQLSKNWWKSLMLRNV